MDNIMPALQTYSIFAAAMAAGANLATSIMAFLVLRYATGQTLVTQWKILYDSGPVPVVSTALTSALGFATLAYRTTLAPALTPTGDVSHGKRNLYAAAAVAMFGLVPYTCILVFGAINELSRRATEGKAVGEKADSSALVERWGTLNFWRGIMMLTRTGLAVWASVSKQLSRKGCWREELLNHGEE